MSFSFYLEKKQELHRESVTKIIWISIFMGISILLILLNLILWFHNRNKLYLVYVIYSILSIIYLLVTTGFSRFLLLPEFLYHSEVRIYSGVFWGLALNEFLIRMLGVRNNPKFQKFKTFYRYYFLLNFASVALSLLCLIGNLNPLLRFFFTLSYSLFALSVLVLIVIIFKNYKINRKNTLYVLFSFVPHIIWVLAIVLSAFKIEYLNIHINWLVFIMLYEVILFGFLLSSNFVTNVIHANNMTRELFREKELSIQQIQKAQLKERSKISNLIHDSFGSKLAFIGHMIELGKIDEAKHYMSELNADIRGISHQIMPRSLEENALLGATNTLVEMMNRAYPKIEFTFQHSANFPEEIDEPWIADVYLIIVELMYNAQRHGKAKSIHVSFEKTDKYHFQVTDDGVGFEVNEKVFGFGITTMIKRIEQFKGTTSIVSSKEKGTTVSIKIE